MSTTSEYHGEHAAVATANVAAETPRTLTRNSRTKCVVTASSVGAIIDWYDFFRLWSYRWTVLRADK